MNQLKLAAIFTSTLVFIVMVFTLLVPVARISAENVLDPVCTNTPDATLCQDNQKTQAPGDNTLYGPNGIVTKVVRLLSLVIGVAAVIMIMIGGFKYIIASGDSSNINSAKNTILYAVIGLVISISAQAIIIFVINKL